MKTQLHAAAASIALLCITAFWIATCVSELLLSPADVVEVKRGVVRAMWVLIPALATTGMTGFFLGRGNPSPLVSRKQRRMAFIALNGLCVLLPSALFLYDRAATGRFDLPFRIVQSIELAAGAANILLMSLNLRDGLKLTGRLRLGRDRAHISG